MCDGWSFWRLLDELGGLLQAERDGVEPAPAEAVPSFAEHVAEQQEWLEAAPGRKQFAYWQSALAEPWPALDLPSTRRRDAPPAATARDTVTLALDPELTRSLRELASRHGSSMFAILLTGYYLLLHRLGGQSRLAVGSPLPARGSRWDRTLGSFTNPVALRAEIDPEASVESLLKQVGSTAWRALKNQSYPLAELVERAEPGARRIRAAVLPGALRVAKGAGRLRHAWPDGAFEGHRRGVAGAAFH